MSLEETLNWVYADLKCRESADSCVKKMGNVGGPKTQKKQSACGYQYRTTNFGKTDNALYNNSTLTSLNTTHVQHAYIQWPTWSPGG